MPVVRLPARRETLRVACRKARVVEHELGAGPLRYQLEPRDGIGAGLPASGPPRLHDARVGHELDVTPLDPGAEKGEGPAFRAVDLRRLAPSNLAEPLGVHGIASYARVGLALNTTS